MPLLTNNNGDFSKRTLFFEWGRGFPIPFQNFAAINGNFKLVGRTYNLSGMDGFKLFDLRTDTSLEKLEKFSKGLTFFG